MDRIHGIINSLKNNYADAKCELNFRNNYELIVAVVLSAQCTDKRVNEVTPKLFEICPSFLELEKINQSELEDIIRSCGFYHSKAKNLKALAHEINSKHNGEVPREKQDLLLLSGVGEKTANVVLAEAFSVPAIAVDTHVFRVSNRLGLANHRNVLGTQRQLEKHIPKDFWIKAHHALILHGRYVCKSQRPDCKNCKLKKYCKHYEEKVLPNFGDRPANNLK